MPLFNACFKLDSKIFIFLSTTEEPLSGKSQASAKSKNSLDSLYSGSKLSFEFLRTKSRLVEMQSDEYRFGSN